MIKKLAMFGGTAEEEVCELERKLNEVIDHVNVCKITHGCTGHTTTSFGRPFHHHGFVTTGGAENANKEEHETKIHLRDPVAEYEKDRIKKSNTFLQGKVRNQRKELARLNKEVKQLKILTKNYKRCPVCASTPEDIRTNITVNFQNQKKQTGMYAFKHPTLDVFCFVHAEDLQLAVEMLFRQYPDIPKYQWHEEPKQFIKII